MNLHHDYREQVEIEEVCKHCEIRNASIKACRNIFISSLLALTINPGIACLSHIGKANIIIIFFVARCVSERVEGLNEKY
jgi:hypothetical protein